MDIGSLRDKGQGKKLIIIGAGNSAPALNDMNVDGYDLMGINWVFLFPERIKYLVYSDRNVAEWYERRLQIYPSAKVIGYKKYETLMTDYYYDEEDIDIGTHTGYHALQIAQLIMNYDEICLIGYDYYDKDGKVHYFGDKIHKQNWRLWDGFYIDRDNFFKKNLADFDKIDWDEGIFNLNKYSRLDIFPNKVLNAKT